MTADLLRRAAAKIRETAVASYPGPWRWDENYGGSGDEGLALTNDAGDEVIGSYNHHCCSFRDDPTVRDQEQAHIALWSPDVAELVASLLDGAVVRYASLTTDDIEMRTYGLDPRQAEEALHREFALARRILGEAEQP